MSSSGNSHVDEYPPAALASVVRASPLPVVILDVNTERIVAASGPARELVSGGSGDIEGRPIAQFLKDSNSGGLDLIRAGRVSGYETCRTLNQGDISLQVWVRAVVTDRPVRYAVVVLLGGPNGRPSGLAPISEREPAVIGTTDSLLVVDRISTDVQDILGLAMDELVGQSVFSLVDESDAATLLLAIADATQRARGITFSVRCRPQQGHPNRTCQLLVVPLPPAPSIGFALFPGTGDIQAQASRDDCQQFLSRITQTIDAAATSREMATLRAGDAAGWPSLSSRELEIVGRLLSGDRVPAIAKALFLSQSTVRNHLSSLFRKFHVGSQQELIDLLRDGRRIV